MRQIKTTNATTLNRNTDQSVYINELEEMVKESVLFIMNVVAWEYHRGANTAEALASNEHLLNAKIYKQFVQEKAKKFSKIRTLIEKAEASGDELYDIKVLKAKIKKRK
jgi:hypothetical protein